MRMHLERTRYQHYNFIKVKRPELEPVTACTMLSYLQLTPGIIALCVRASKGRKEGIDDACTDLFRSRSLVLLSWLIQLSAYGVSPGKKDHSVASTVKYPDLLGYAEVSRCGLLARAELPRTRPLEILMNTRAEPAIVAMAWYHTGDQCRITLRVVFLLRNCDYWKYI
jgi:hypothetical protein